MTTTRPYAAAYRLRTPVDLPALLGTFHSFTVPEHWPGILRQVWERDGKPHNPTWNLPIARGLNQTLRALAPAVLSTGTMTLESPNSWLYARQPLDSGLLKRTMLAHVQRWLGDASDYPRLRDAVSALDVEAHGDDWAPVQVDPEWLRTNEAGTAIVEDPLYRLIPEVVAERILGLGPYDNQLSFVQVPTNDGAELMSWPPLTHAGRKNRAGESVTSHYSAVLKITLRTVPFDPMPRLHLGVSMRRWVSGGKLYVPAGLKPSVYLRPQPDPASGVESTRFAVASLAYSKKHREYVWTANGPAGMLQRLTIDGRFPDAARIKADPGAHLPPTSGLEAAVAHHTRMNTHRINTGIMPDERRRILTWAAQALPSAFEPALELEHATGILRTTKQYVSPKRTDATAENARRNRELLARGMQQRELCVDLITDTDAVRESLVTAAGNWLGLDPAASPDVPPDHVVFHDGDLRVRLICHNAGRLTSKLGGENAPSRGDAHRQAIRDRATEVNDYLDAQELATELALVEIAKPDDFEGRRRDPYHAIRQGAARAGRVTQFIASSGDDDLRFRAESAWADGLRCLGLGLIPPHSTSLGLPEEIDQVAIWQVRRNTTTAVTDPVYMPIAVLLRAGETRVLARMPGTNGWIPYHQMLCQLASAPPRPEELKKPHRQSEELTRFLRTTLPSLRGRPLLLLAEAANLRSRWTWLTDAGLRADRISLGEPGTSKLALHNKDMRVVRVRTDRERLETPTWWVAPDPSGVSGYTSGLLQEAGADGDNRVFYSLTQKSSKLGKNPKALKKFTSSGGERLAPHKATPVPRLLEITVAGLAPSDDAASAAAWAAFVHQQRLTADYSDGRRLPYALDLCAKAGGYAFPEAARDDGAEDEVDG